MKRRTFVTLPLVCVFVHVVLTTTETRADDIGTTDIQVPKGPIQQVRFVSDRVVYLEELVKDPAGDRWSGRYWNSNARINWPFELWDENAFHIELNGEPVSGGWSWIGASEVPKTDRGARHFVVELFHADQKIAVKLHTVLDGTPVLTRWLEITNRGEKSVALTAISPWSSAAWANPGVKYPPETLKEPFRVGYFTRSDWASEGWFNWQTVLPGKSRRVESVKGYGYDEPFFILQNRFTGEHVIGHLSWCSNWYMEFTAETIDPDKHPWGDVLAASTYLRFKLGPFAKDALRVIAPKETITSPSVHVGVVTGSLDAAVQAMHDHTRRFVMPPAERGRRNLIQYLAPGDQGYMDEHGDQTKGAVFANIDMAAAIGAELFILDCGWFRERGDFFPSKKRFPEGLDPIVAYCRKNGLRFGLWTEVERCQKSTQIARVKPEWRIEEGILDLTKPAVAQYVEAELHRQINDYKTDLIRLAYDCYFPFEGMVVERDGFRENTRWRYYETFDDIFDRARQKYPHIIWQNCSAGIGRGGLGMTQRFHEAYIGDGLWLPQVLLCYAGRSLAFPPEMFVVAHGAVREQALGRPANLDTFLRCQFTLSVPQLYSGMVGPSLKSTHPERLERFRHYAKLYKTFIRPLWPTSRVFHHDPVNRGGGVESSPWFAMEFASPDKRKAWATIVRVGYTDDNAYLFKPKGLDIGKTYRVTFDSSGSSIDIRGLELIRDGLAIPLESRVESELLLFEAR